MKLNKLAALFLFTSRGITMIHSGQEFARSKVIPLSISEEDPHKGMIDHNSYEKDNETNYINYDHVKINEELFNYYKGLIELRKTFKAFRRADYNDVKFFNFKGNPFAMGYSVKYKDEEFIVLFNADQKMILGFDLPEGEWDVIVDENIVDVNSIKTVDKKIILNYTTGIVLKKR
jgi:pullulanase/glycogen debranching enzyme